MPIELRILSGARGGHRQSFDKPVVAVGRHPTSDLQLDPNGDLDVSTRHAEIHAVRSDGRYRIRDNNSTNGTFLNGRRIVGEEDLADGDVIWLGAEGPHVEVRLAGRVEAEAGKVGREVNASRSPQPAPRGLLVATVVLLVTGVGGAYWAGHREAQMQVGELRQLLAQSESTAAQLKARLGSVGDTTLMNAVLRQNAEMAARAHALGAGASVREVDSLKNELRRRQAIQSGLATMDLSKISERNDSAIAFLVTELDGKPYGGTAFGVGADGLLVTNKHNVRSERGRAATRIGVKYANTDVFLPAHVVTIAADDADLALLQVDRAGNYPTVAGVARSIDSVRVGSPVMTIGFPHALDTPMDGALVKTSLTAGTVSKVLPTVVQVDAYASHGSSGSPIFNADGWVIGVIYGGEKESDGRLVFAVPSPRLVPLLPARAAGVVR